MAKTARAAGDVRPAVLAAWIALPWLAWAWLCHERWSGAVEFHYGWGVLPLAVYLAALRWADRPVAARDSRARDAVAAALGLAGAAVVALAVVVLVPNRLWTAWLWLAGGGAIAASAALLARAGGRAWVRWWGFVLVFPLTALPWPAMVQIPVNTTLKAANARFAAEVSSTLGHPAVVTGNLIEVGGGVVGVEDACSGLRALQAVVMLALFFGELLRLTAARRVVLLAVGVALALAANAARTIFLTLQMAWRGPEGVASWHDPAGVTELVLALVGVWLAVAWLKPRAAPAPPSITQRAPQAGAVSAAGWLGPALAALLAAGFVGAHFWYRGSGAAPEVARLQLRRPAGGWTDYALPEAARAMLQCSTAEGAITTGPAREGMIALHLRWDRDPGVRYLAGLHAPEVCLPAVGATFERALPPQRLELGGRTIVLEARRFHDRHGPLHLFFGLWDAERGRSLSVQENAAADFAAERWRLVRERRRSLALEQLTFAVAGCADDELAFDRLQRTAAQLVRLEAGPP